MRVPLSAPGRLVDAHRPALDAAIADVLDSGSFVLGRHVERFEEAWAALVGSRFCVGVANGTDALELALRAVGAVGREVVTVANAGGYSSTACAMVGATPVHVDVSEETLTIDLEAATAAVTDSTAAVIVTHLYGWVVDVPRLRSMLDESGRPGVRIIEDCAQSHLGRLDDAVAGSLGDVGCFSFYPTKNLGALGDAGAVVTNDASLADDLFALRQYGWGERYVQRVAGGRNSRLDEIQAAMLLVYLPMVEGWNEQRRTIAKRYVDAGAPMLHDCFDRRNATHLAVARVHRRDAWRSALGDLGVATGVHFPSLDAGVADGTSLPVSRRSCRSVVSLPCFPSMRMTEIDHVCRAIEASVGPDL